MSKRFAIGAVAVMILLAVGAFALPRLKVWRARSQATREREWILKTVRELEQAPASSVEVNHDAERFPWVISDYLIFSNGWAAYRIHTAHENDGVGDIALLRTSDGHFYSSKLHYCVGLHTMMRERVSQWPADAEDFFDYYGRDQQWNLLSPDNRLWSVISCPSSRRSTQKTLWVWIGTSSGTADATLFEQRYKITGGFISWKIGWSSSNDLNVVVYDFGGITPYMHGHESYLRSNYVTTLAFHLDKQTGRITDEHR